MPANHPPITPKASLKPKTNTVGKILFISKLYNYLFGDWADIEKHAKDIKFVKSDEKVKEKLIERYRLKKTQDIKEFFHKFNKDKLQLAIADVKNSSLEKILFDAKSVKSSAPYFPTDKHIQHVFKFIDHKHRLFVDEKESVPDLAKKRFVEIFKVCKVIGDAYEENNDGNNELVYMHAYKIMALFGYEFENLLMLFKIVDEYMDKNGFYTESPESPLHDLLIGAVPTIEKGESIHLKEWQAFIKKSPKKALSIFNNAPGIEKELKEKCPASVDEAMAALKKIAFKLKGEHPILADIMVSYGFNEKIFNRALEVFRRLKKRDNLPNITVSSDDFKDDKGNADLCRGYHLVKLPIDDPNAFVLGEITNCCQSMGGDSEACVIDGITREDNGFYVLLKAKQSPPDSKQQPLVDGKINYTYFKIVGQCYAWKSKKDNLVIDSWENLTPKKEDKVIVPMLYQFAKKATQTNDAPLVVNIGIGGKTPEELATLDQTISEDIKQGKQYDDSKKQVRLFFNEIRQQELYTELEKLIPDEKFRDEKSRDVILSDNINKIIRNYFRLQNFISLHDFELAKKFLKLLKPNDLKVLLTIKKILLEPIFPISNIVQLMEMDLFNEENIRFIVKCNYSLPSDYRITLDLMKKLKEAGLEINDEVRHELAYMDRHNAEIIFFQFTSIFSRLRDDKIEDPFLRRAYFVNCELKRNDQLDFEIKTAYDKLKQHGLNKYPAVIDNVFNIQDYIAPKTQKMINAFSKLRRVNPELEKNEAINKFVANSAIDETIYEKISKLSELKVVDNPDIWLAVINYGSSSPHYFYGVVLTHQSLKAANLEKSKVTWLLFMQRSLYIYPSLQQDTIIAAFKRLQKTGLDQDDDTFNFLIKFNPNELADKINYIVSAYKKLKEAKLENEPIARKKLLLPNEAQQDIFIPLKVNNYKLLQEAKMLGQEDVVDSVISQNISAEPFIKAFQLLKDKGFYSDPLIRSGIIGCEKPLEKATAMIPAFNLLKQHELWGERFLKRRIVISDAPEEEAKFLIQAMKLLSENLELQDESNALKNFLLRDYSLAYRKSVFETVVKYKKDGVQNERGLQDIIFYPADEKELPDPEKFFRAASILKKEKMSIKYFVQLYIEKYTDEVDDICAAYIKLTKASLENNEYVLRHIFTVNSFKKIDTIIRNIKACENLMLSINLQLGDILRGILRNNLESDQVVSAAVFFLTETCKLGLNEHPIVYNLSADFMMPENLGIVTDTIKLLEDEKISRNSYIYHALSSSPQTMLEDTKRIVRLLKDAGYQNNEKLQKILFTYQDVSTQLADVIIFLGKLTQRINSLADSKLHPVFYQSEQGEAAKFCQSCLQELLRVTHSFNKDDIKNSIFNKIIDFESTLKKESQYRAVLDKFLSYYSNRAAPFEVVPDKKEYLEGVFRIFNEVEFPEKSKNKPDT